MLVLSRLPRRFFVLLLVVALALSAAPPAAGQSEGAVLDPLPDPTVSGLGLVLEEFVTIPESEPIPEPGDRRLDRANRINYLGEVPDGSGRLFVPDLNGKMYLIEDQTPHEYLDVGATFSPEFWSHAGLGSGFGFVAFHPEFAENGKFYTVHTEARDALEDETPDLPEQNNTVMHGVITEWTADDPSANAFSGSSREVLRVGFATRIHGFQEIGFNPTAEPGDEDYGLLYISAGDGGVGVSTDDPQDLSRPHGKILRIDPLGTNGVNGEYGIPDSNPFVDDPDALGEIYAIGLRNPHRFSWDSQRPHRMFVGNIGQWHIESIYEVTKGANFGWSEREGPYVFNKDDFWVYPLPEDDKQFGFTYPVAAYDHNREPGQTGDLGVAVVGGFVYRGRAVPELRGQYIFGDIPSGRIFHTNAGEMRSRNPNLAKIREAMVYDASGQRTSMQELVGDERVDLRFGQDADGELYVLAKANGKIYKVTDTRRFASCDVGDTTVRRATRARDWEPVSPEKWEFRRGQVILAEPGENPGPPRRPFEYAVLTKGPEFGSVRVDGEVRIDTPVEISNRDVIIVFGYRSATEFYYAHLSTDNTIFPHNGIFVVNNADRDRIEDQWDEERSLGAAPAIPDEKWHDVRVVHCADSGEIAVYLDGSDTPLMTAVDSTFDSGRVGFGSFDNIGRLRDLKVRGTAVDG